MPRGAGRKRCPVESLFKNLPKSKSGSTGKCDRVQCNFCAQSIARNGTRMKTHIIKKCSKCPSEVRKKYIQKLGHKAHSDSGKICNKPIQTTATMTDGDKSQDYENTDVDLNEWLDDLDYTVDGSDCVEVGDRETGDRHDRESSERSLSLTPKKKSVSTSKITSFLDRMSDVNKAKADELLARAAYATGTPLHFVENAHWKNFFSFIRPIYKLPSRYGMSNSLLNMEYERVKASVTEAIAAAPSVGLMCDGWSNIRNESVVNFVVSTPSPLLYKSLATGKASHTADYMAKEIEAVIDEIGPSKVFGFVSDNAANMKAAWLLLEKHYATTNLFCYGCAAHGLNLLFKDFKGFESLHSCIASTTSMIKTIRASHKLKSLFEEKQTTPKQGLQLPVQTRWASVVLSLQSVLHNKHALQALVIDEEAQGMIKNDAAFKSNLLSEVFWDKISGFLTLLEPILIAIRKVESDQPCISHIVKIFQDLQEHFHVSLPCSPLSKGDEKKAAEAILSRKNFCITIIHKAANLLDPAFHGAQLTPDEQTDATEKIYEIAHKIPGVDPDVVLAELACYRAKEGFFAKEFLWRCVGKISACGWWKGMCSSQSLSKVAVCILNLPPSSAACERSFSTYGNVHTKKRNRLTNTRAAKLVYVQYNLKLQQEPLSKSQPLSITTNEPTVSNVSSTPRKSRCTSVSPSVSGPSPGTSHGLTEYSSTSSEIDTSDSGDDITLHDSTDSPALASHSSEDDFGDN